MGNGPPVTRHLLLCLALLAPSLTFADVAPGARARVTLLEGPRVVGTIRALPLDAITLTAEPDSTERVIPYASIAKLEIQNGTKTHAGRYALVGGVLAAIPGAILGANLGEDLEVNETEQFYFAAGGAVAFGLVGAGIGALIGKGERVERWERVR